MNERELAQPEKIEIPQLDKLLAQLLATYGEAESISVSSAPDREGVSSRLIIRRQLSSRQPSSLINLQVATDYFPGYFRQTLEQMTREERLEAIANREIFMSVIPSRGRAKTLLLKTKRELPEPEEPKVEHFSLLAGLKESSAQRARTLSLASGELQEFERLALALAQQLAVDAHNNEPRSL
ncbi:MAG TPA: hypothetical protein VMW04_01060 [Patescibacteria group bacterium]|nr:hypothetical protein [Patescibacteria group bacterium]